jgi:hypothetical protein
MKNVLLSALAIATLALPACKKDAKKEGTPAGDPVTKEGSGSAAKPDTTTTPDTTAKPDTTTTPDTTAKPDTMTKGGAGDWVPYTSEAGGFTVKFPKQATEQTQTLDTEHGPVDLHMAVVDMGNKAFLVSWQVQPAKAPKDAKVVLDGQRDGMVAGMPGSKVVDQKDITLGSHPGRSMTVKLSQPVGTQYSRVYLIDGKLFQLAAIGEGDGDPEMATTFLESFALTKK